MWENGAAIAIAAPAGGSQSANSPASAKRKTLQVRERVRVDLRSEDTKVKQVSEQDRK